MGPIIKIIETDQEKKDVINEWDKYTNKSYNNLNPLNEAFELNKILDNLKRIYSENNENFPYGLKKDKKML